MKSIPLTLLLGLLSLSWPVHGADKPNVLVILTDDLGYGDLGCFGSTYIRTPQVDKLAAEGLRFTHAYAPASTCTPSRYALLTGEYAWRQTARKTSILDGDAPLCIEPGRPTLPGLMRQAGYRTGVVGKWHLGLGDGQTRVDFNGEVKPGPLEIGFDYCHIIPATVDRVPSVWIENHRVVGLDPADPIQVSYLTNVSDEPTGLQRPDLLKQGADKQHSCTIINGISRIGYMKGGRAARFKDEDLGDTVVTKTIEFMERHKEGPFFLYVGMFEPHVPRTPHARFVGGGDCGVRGDVIRQMDDSMGRILAALDRLKIADNTLVIFSSDNGPVLFDGYYDRSVEDAGGHRPAGGLRGWKYLTFEGGTRVPFIVRWAGRVPVGVTDQVICLTDLLATCSALAGSKLPQGAGVDSLDLSRVLLGKTKQQVRDSVVQQGVSGAFAIRKGDWKFIPASGGASPGGIGSGANPKDTRFKEAVIAEPMLFNLKTDPGETNNLAPKEPAKVKELADRLKEIRQERTQNVATDPALLTLDRIFGAGEFKERGLGEFKWSKRTPSYFTLETPPADGKGRDLVRNDAATGRKEIVVPASAFVPEGQSEPLQVESFEFSADESKLLLYTNSKRVWRRNTRGDYWVLDLAARQLRKLGGAAAPSTLMFAKFSPDGTRVAYVRENNLYVQELRRMKITALTRDGSPTLINGTSDWVNEEELSIRDAYRWSPDGRSIAFWQFDTSGVRQFHLLNNTADTYPKITSFAYPKVGETNSATRVGVIRATGGRVRWLKLPGDPRNHYIPHAEWSPDGQRLQVQQFNRLQNTNRVMLADPKSGAVRTVLTETDAAWLENENPVQWMDGGSKFLWLSERDGWRHAYSAGTDGQHFARITGGDFDVIQVEAVDEKNGWLYFSASPENPTQHYLYRTRLSGGTPERLSPAAQPGWHTYDFSPDTQWAMHTYSTFTNPPVVELVQFPGHKVVRVLADNQELREKLAALKRPTAELLKLDIGDGVSLDAWCLKPLGLNPSAKYPLLINVYGEPASQTVTDRWRGGSGLWHWMLAQQGYIVASMENRGTPVPRGRAWRKLAHRQIGILAAQDQAAGVRALLKLWPYADAGRVGVWGWSGGGSMSLNAIFRYPDLYSTAMAVAPNPSQLLYDTIYQERYMGLPKDNAENYRLGSPITHASQLKGNLLLVHGTGDDNGHYQGTERLMNELIAHHKHFTVMPYPNRSHAISEGPNTTQHLYGLLTRYLREHLPVNPVRVVFETELGAITMEADVARAPVTAANFLRYVDGKFYDGGMINRAVRPDNTVRHDVEVQVIQFQSDPARENEMFPPIPMERTSVRGLRNVNGALSMARNGPDTAQASFSIVIGDQPEMDFGGKRNPDGQGFAVFGRVVDGWDVVKKIHQSHTGTDGEYKTETLDPPIKILRAYQK